jgi:hypothetical protein
MISTGARSIPLSTAGQLPTLFPFSLTVRDTAGNERLDMLRQGLDNDVLMRVEAAPKRAEKKKDDGQLSLGFDV